MVASASCRTRARRYGSVYHAAKLDQRVPAYARITNDPESFGGRIGHPGRKVRQGTVGQFDNKCALATKARSSNNTKLLTVSRMETVVNGYLGDVSMGSMLPA